MESRRLVAIMFTDVVGYTSLAQKNEKSAMELLAEHEGILRPIFQKFHGREVKTIGDSFLVEFPSALQAVQCAHSIQEYFRERNARVSPEKKMLLRVGVHVGDVVIHDDGDLLGDAVNIASRIEPLADPGGICISGQVHEYVRNKSDLAFVRVPTPSLKGVHSPVEVYKWVQDSHTLPDSNSPSLDKTRVAVLPFANISPDPTDEYFADGMTEELIKTLASIRELTVIARTSVMKYKNSSQSASEIGRELYAGTLIEGSVRKAGNKVRITVQLIDALTEGHRWAESYDKQLDDIFEIQTSIAEKIAAQLKVELLDSEKQQLKKKPTENTEAYTLYLKGTYWLNKRTRESMERGLKYFQLALDSDPLYALAYAGISDYYSASGNYGYVEPKLAHQRSMEAALKAVELDDTLSGPHLSLGWVSMVERDWKRSELEHRRALDLSPHDARAHRWHGHFLFFVGSYEEGLAEFDYASQLDPQSALANLNIAEGLAIIGDYDRAEFYYRKALEMEQFHVPTLVSFVYFLAEKGKYDEALEIQRILLDQKFPSSRAELFRAYILAKKGALKEARAILEQLLARSQENASFIPAEEFAAVYTVLGDWDRAFDLLQRSMDVYAEGFLALKYAPRFNSLKSDPRFSQLLTKANLDLTGKWKKS